MKLEFLKGMLPIVLLVFSNAIFAQQKYSAKDNINMEVAGTSTMHDWVMTSTIGECTAVFTMDEAGVITGLTSMNFSVSSKALKSGKDGMDKNAYKTLKVDANPRITAVLRSATVTTTDNVNYTIQAKIGLTIAGKTLETPLSVVAKVKGNTISITGQKKISMKDYSMSPPTFMLGAVKTGNDVTLKFNFNLTKQ